MKPNRCPLSDHPDASDLAQREARVLADLTATVARLLADPRDIAALVSRARDRGEQWNP